MLLTVHDSAFLGDGFYAFGGRGGFLSAVVGKHDDAKDGHGHEGNDTEDSGCLFHCVMLLFNCYRLSNNMQIYSNYPNFGQIGGNSFLEPQIQGVADQGVADGNLVRPGDGPDIKCKVLQAQVVSGIQAQP